MASATPDAAVLRPKHRTRATVAATRIEAGFPPHARNLVVCLCACVEGEYFRGRVTHIDLYLGKISPPSFEHIDFDAQFA
jgi:hypothetical protein